MQFAHFDSSKVIPYDTIKPSSRAGCSNVILPDGRVLSAHGDDRDPGSDGPWEQGMVSGNAVQYLADGVFFVWLLMPSKELPR